MRRLGVKNLIPLDLSFEETLRKIKKDKRAATQTKQPPMDNMDGFREEEIGSKMGDGMTPDIAHLDNVLRPIRDYAHPPSTTQLMIRRPAIQANNFEQNPSLTNSCKEFNSLDSHTRTRMPTS